jgi:hypothetical protein
LEVGERMSAISIFEAYTNGPVGRQSGFAKTVSAGDRR